MDCLRPDLMPFVFGTPELRPLEDGPDVTRGNLPPALETRQTALRLRATMAEPPLALPSRAHLLWGLVTPEHATDRTLELTYLLRRDAPLEVALVLRTVRAAEPLAAAPVPVAKQHIETLARVVLPGFSPVAPDKPVLTGASAPLAFPGIDVLAETVSAGPASHGPRAVAADTAPRLLLAPTRRLTPGVDQPLLGLAQTGFDVDLVISVGAAPLPARTLRALTDTRAALLAALHAAGDAAAPIALRSLAAIERWLRTPGPVFSLAASLRFPADLDPAVVRVAHTLLFGPTALRTAAQASDTDLSASLPLDGPRPSLLPLPATVAALQAMHRRRFRRAPSGPGLVLGSDRAGRRIAVGAADLRQHCYVLGATGTGKSTLMRSMILQDLKADVPVFVCDPHGDLHEDLLAEMPEAQRRRAIVADAGNFANPFSLNILDVRGPHAAIQRNYVANQLISLFKMVYGANKDAFGPMFESYFRGALLLLMDARSGSASLADMERLFGDRAYRRSLLEDCTDPQIRSFWTNIALRAGGDADLHNVAPYITSKLVQLSGNALIRPILCAPETTLDLPMALTEGRSVFVNLAKGLVGGPDAAILGGVITLRLVSAAIARAALPAAERRLTRVYLDEFPAYGAHGILAEAMAEIRKFGISLVLANQSVAQIDGRGGDVAHAILANCGSLLAFRLGPKDAHVIAEWLGPEVSTQALMRLANHSFIARLLRDGVPLAPVEATTLAG